MRYCLRRPRTIKLNQQNSALFLLWSGIQLDHRFENGQPLSGKLADPFVVNFKYLF